MYMPETYRDNLVNDFLKALGCRTQEVEQERVLFTDGGTLINMGITETKDGTPIFHGISYWYAHSVTVTIDHVKNCRVIIELCDNMEQVEEQLAGYLVRYGKPPAHLQTNKQG